MAGYDIKKAVANVGAKPLNFSFYKGEDADQIFISSAPPTTPQVQGINKECGKTTVLLKGICFREAGVLVFATKAKPAPQWKMQISSVLKERKCQGVSKIDLRQLGPNDSDVVGVEGDATKDGDKGSTALDVNGVKALSAQWTTAREAA